MNPIWLNAVGASGGGLWYRAGGSPQPVAAYQPKGAASLATSYVNLANPGVNDATVNSGGAPTWNALNGWGWAGGNLTALLTGVVPAAGYSMVIRFSNSVSNRPELAGSFDGGNNRFLIHSSSAVATIRYYYGSTFNDGSAGLAGGVVAMTPAAGYLNGVAITTIAGVFNTASTRQIWIGGANGVANGAITGNIQAVAIYNTTLTAPQVAAVSAAIAAL
jgi:hypothetical protein